MIKTLPLILAAIMTILGSCNAQISTSSHKKRVEDSPEQKEVFEILRRQDSLLFKLGYNHCDTALLRFLISDDFEFYHDQGGLSTSKEAFIGSIPRLCNLDYKPTRELLENSLEVFLLKNNGTLYGAIQHGEHLFYGQKGEQPKYLTSSAKFTHVWILEEGAWKLKRVLSYDHQAP